MIFTDKTVAEVLAGENPPIRKPHCSTFEAHKEITIFIPFNITEDVVELVAQKLSGSVGTGGTE